MTTERRQSREVDGKGRTVRELLGGRKYSIDYYQREYKWKSKQVMELIDDLSGKFRESHEEGNERSAVAEYGHYFLGSVIVSDKDGEKFIIDGQQRLTTLTLLMIFLQRRTPDEDQKAQVADLIFSQKYGKRSFNLDIPERTPCMESLYAGEHFDENGQSESVTNVLARYSDIQDHFPEELLGEPLPYFVDWLIENVHLVEITAYSDDDAYTIFETMNDRGLSLAPADMLKGYLLANITDQSRRNAASREWALPESRYLSITFTMPDTLWPLFAANPRLCRRLAEIAARVIGNYARVRKGAEVGVMPVLQTFNGKLEFNPHVHTLVTAGDLQTAGPQGVSSIFFDRYELRDSWQRLVMALLRGALEAGQLKSGMPRDEVERLLQEEEKRAWYPSHVQADEKGHFLSYGGRYQRRPPFTERRIISIANGFVWFWYMDKKTLRRETVRCTVQEFIDRWAQHIPQHYRHAVRHFGLFAPRRWAQVASAVFSILGTPQRPRPKRLPWAVAIQELGGLNPRVDHKGQPMKFVGHIAPEAS